jgi:hypothetical protein
MKLQRKDKVGLLMDTWDMFLSSSKILDAAVCIRLTHCECDCSRQKPKYVTSCHVLRFDAIVNTTLL